MVAFARSSVPSLFLRINFDPIYCGMSDSESNRELTLGEEQEDFPDFSVALGSASSHTGLWIEQWTEHGSPPPEASLPILRDWATALHACHAMDVVHGRLTPESVGIANGRGTLLASPVPQPLWTDPDDDVHGARWTATELFRLEDCNPQPTKMSDVYSFACLMLQMLTGRVPYCGTKRPEQVVYLKYLGRQPIDAQTPKVADRYVAFMRWCWSPEPEKRPTMETVINFIHEEIKRFEEGAANATFNK